MYENASKVAQIQLVENYLNKSSLPYPALVLLCCLCGSWVALCFFFVSVKANPGRFEAIETVKLVVVILANTAPYGDDVQHNMAHKILG